MAAIASADVYFSIGVPFEQAWLNTIKMNNQQLRMVNCCEQFQDDNSHSKHVHKHGDHEVADPHIWTNPLKVIAMTRLLEEELSRLDPKNAQRYKAAAQRFITQLDELDSYIRTETRALEKRVLIVTHPSWSYFANEYGFQQIAIEQNGVDAKAASLTRLVEKAREQDIKVVFDQPQFYNKAARVLASEIGAQIITLDPLAFDYLANMRESTRLIAQGLSVE